MFEECWPYAHSFYAITKTHPTMAVSPRILQAGNCAEHNSLKMAFEESVVQIDTQAWTDSLAEGAGVANRADIEARRDPGGHAYHAHWSRRAWVGRRRGIVSCKAKGGQGLQLEALSRPRILPCNVPTVIVKRTRF